MLAFIPGGLVNRKSIFADRLCGSGTQSENYTVNSLIPEVYSVSL